VSAPLDLRERARQEAPEVPGSLAERARAVGTWRGRMVNEHGSSAVFEALARQLEDAGFAEEAAACEEFAEEERTHGVLCGAVVEALGGEALAPALPERALPLHADAAPAEAALRNVLSVGCLSETVAVALIGAEWQRMSEGALRDLLARIYADEIGHARFGWAFARKVAPTLDAAALARTGAYLRVAFGHLEAHELAHLPVAQQPTPEIPELGVCDGRDARALFYATVHEVIVPRLADLGLPAAEAWEQRVRA
jgi:hypothetical protein